MIKNTYKLVAFLTLIVVTMLIMVPFVMAEDNNVPTAEDVINKINGGKKFAVSLDEFTNTIIDLSIKIIRVLQTIAAPIAIISMIVGAIAYVIGLISLNTQLRKAGSGSIFGGLIFLVVIKLAPVIVATVEGFIK
jgi:hypothetical protein